MSDAPTLSEEPHTNPKLRVLREETFARMAETDKRLRQGTRTLKFLKLALTVLMMLFAAIATLMGWISKQNRENSDVVNARLTDHVQQSGQIHERILRTEEQILGVLLENPRERHRLRDGGIP